MNRYEQNKQLTEKGKHYCPVCDLESERLIEDGMRHAGVDIRSNSGDGKTSLMGKVDGRTGCTDVWEATCETMKLWTKRLIAISTYRPGP
jgi:hypothetical protein